MLAPNWTSCTSCSGAGAPAAASAAATSVSAAGVAAAGAGAAVLAGVLSSLQAAPANMADSARKVIFSGTFLMRDSLGVALGDNGSGAPAAGLAALLLVRLQVHPRRLQQGRVLA